MSIRRRVGATLSFHNITYEVETSTGPCCCGQKQRKMVLNNVNGLFECGMHAIMGPTGSGKTSLLDVIAARKDPDHMSGFVLMNGKKPPKNFRLVSGYVSQDDIIMGTLTVRENLQYSAAMRLPMSVTEQERNAKVQEVIDELGLAKCADSKVGTEFIRGISGGERKRTNIGMELITSPEVLFLDEPTTGLDSNTAFTVMELLKELSQKKQTVIFSIHQPRYSIYKLFDTLMLLDAGQTVYYGEGSEALNYFANIGYLCEPHNNPPDFFLDVLNGASSPAAPLRDQPQHGFTDIPLTPPEHNTGVVPLSYGKINPAFEISRDGDGKDHVVDIELSLSPTHLSSTIKKSLAYTYQMSEENAGIMKRLEGIRMSGVNLEDDPKDHTAKDRKIHFATSMPRQLHLTSRRAVLNLFRNPAFTILNFVVMLFIGLAVGTIYFQVEDTPTAGLQNRVGAFFFIVMNMIFANLSSVEPFIRQRALFIHERSNGYYRTSAYFLAKFFCDVIPNRCLPLIFYALVTYWMIGLKANVANFFVYMLILMLTSVTASGLCFAVSSSITLYSIANLVVTLFYIIMMVFSGLLVSLDDMPAWLSWLKYFSLYRYSMQALMINELKDLRLCEDSVNGTCTSGNDYLASQGIAYEEPWDFWQTQVALASLLLAFMFLSYIQLRRIKLYT